MVTKLQKVFNGVYMLASIIINDVNLVPNIIYRLSSFSWLKVHDVVWIFMAYQILM